MNKHFASKRVAHLLGFAGLIPFVALALSCWIAQPTWIFALASFQRTYGLVILSFLGGVHWGAALLNAELSIERSKLALLWGIAPSLIGVLASQILIGPGLMLLIAAFALVYLVDKRLYSWYGMSLWFLPLRFRLTYVVVATLGLTFLAVNFRS